MQRVGSIRELLEYFAGIGLKTDAPEIVVTINTTVTQLVNNNARRVRLVVTNLGNSPVSYSRFNTVTTTTGKILGPGETDYINWYDELGEIERAIFAIAPAGAQPVLVREVVLV